MPYSVDYVPSFRRKSRAKAKPTGRGKCKITKSDLRRQVRWNLEGFETVYATVSSIEASHLIAALKLNRIVSGYERERGGMNALLMLRKEAGLESRKEHGKLVFDVADTVTRLRTWLESA